MLKIMFSLRKWKGSKKLWLISKWKDSSVPWKGGNPPKITSECRAIQTKVFIEPVIDEKENNRKDCLMEELSKEGGAMAKKNIFFSTFINLIFICTSPMADMVRLYVNVLFQVKPLRTGTISSRTKKKFFQKCLHGPLQGMYQVWSL